MEMIYADDFLSPGGAGTTASLIELSGIDDGSTVLDIGSGLGGSAFYLAAHKCCRVQGIDLMEMNVAEANRRAVSKGLSEGVRFITGDATSLPFADRSFEVVWGQDAWCHVDDKPGLISEAYRVLTSDGLMVFSDWLLQDPQSPAAGDVRQVTASANMGDVQMYQRLLDGYGFVLQDYADTSAELAAEYREVLRRLHGIEAEVCDRFGQKVYDIVLSKQRSVRDAFAAGVLGAGSFVARKRKA